MRSNRVGFVTSLPEDGSFMVAPPKEAHANAGRTQSHGGGLKEMTKDVPFSLFMSIVPSS